MLTAQFHGPDIFTISSFFSAAECAAEIAHAETLGFTDAPITTSQGMVMMKDVRNNDRVMSDDPQRGAMLWDRVSEFVPSLFINQWRAFGVNERLRYYRYDPGQLFNWHLDGAFARSEDEKSFFTFMVYLNDDFEGGETSFHDGRPAFRDLGHFRVKPETGMALLFHHPIRHRGDTVVSGRKYVLRTDVMYRRATKEATILQFPLGV